MFIALVTVLLGASAASTSLPSMTIKEISEWLGAASAEARPFEQRLHETVQRSLGTAYDDGPLGEGPGSKHDPDPIVDLRNVDCVTFIEQTIAFSAAPDYHAAVDLLQKIRYKDGHIDFVARNHFFVADWLKNNGAWCKDVSSELGVATVPLTRTVDREDFFKRIEAPEVGVGLPAEVVSVRYIPTSEAAAAEAKLPDACVITFIGKVEWLFALHCGLWLKEDEGGKLYHASSNSGQVTGVDLSEYMEQQSNRYIGFLVHELSAPTMAAK